MRSVPGAVDLRVHQVFDHPNLEVNVDRSKAALLGVTERDVASNLLVSLSGSFQTTPSFWIDPKTGSQYSVTAQTPQYKLTSLYDLAATPLSASAGGAPQLLANLATFRRGVAPGVVSHYDATPVIDIYGSVQDTDLGFVSAQIDRLIAETRHDVPRGSQVIVRGQIKTMTDSFHGLLAGLAGAVVLIYLLIVVNFQSWRDPFIIITALPAALADIVWMLFLSRTPVSVPALMGAIMCMGVATANSVLVISFARQRMNAGDDALAGGLDRWLHAVPPGSHDGPRHDRRHGADGPWTRRGRRTECAPGPCRDRRSRLRHRGHAVLRTDRLCHDSWPQDRAGVAAR